MVATGVHVASRRAGRERGIEAWGAMDAWRAHAQFGGRRGGYERSLRKIFLSWRASYATLAREVSTGRSGWSCAPSTCHAVRIGGRQAWDELRLAVARCAGGGGEEGEGAGSGGGRGGACILVGMFLPHAATASRNSTTYT